MDNIGIIYHNWLVVEQTPLKNMSLSVGMMTFPTEWENNPNVPNHQPDEASWSFTQVPHKN